MNLSGLDTRRAAAQLEHLFGIAPIFSRRGRRVTVYEEQTKLLFPVHEDGFQPDVYAAMTSLSFRRVVASVANSDKPLTIADLQQKHSDLTAEKVAARLGQATSLGLLAESSAGYIPPPGKNFGASLEWYIAALCVHELASMAFWGVTVEGIVGDYDVVVVRESQIGYIECKSGGARNITENDLHNFLERVQRLAPQFAVFLLDGASLDTAAALAESTRALRPWSMYQLPMKNPASDMVLTERYRRFIRLTPLNIFFVVADSTLVTGLREIYQFLTAVYDRPIVLENLTAKSQFREPTP